MASSAGPQTRFNPEVLKEVLELLPEEAKIRIREADLSKFLEFSTDGLANRWMCSMLMRNSVVDEKSNRVEVRIKEGRSLWITKEVVQHVIDMPIGSQKSFPDNNLAAAKAEYQKVSVLLEYISQKTYVPDKKKGRRGKNQPAEQSGDEQPAEPSNQDAQNQELAGNEQQHAEPPNQDAQNQELAGNEQQHAEPPNQDAQNQELAGNEQQHAEPPNQDAQNQESAGNEQQQQNELFFPPVRKIKDIRGLFNQKNICKLLKYHDDPKVKHHITTDILVRLYLGLAVERFLLPASFFYVNNTTYEKVYNIDMLKNLDWPEIVLKGIMNGCLDFKEVCDKLGEGQEFPRNTNMYGCLGVKLVVFADCLEGNDLPVEQSARMNLYTEKSLNKLLLRGDRRDLSSFELKEWKKSLYGKFYQPEDDAATVYQTYVLDKSRHKLVLDFGDYRVEQGIFVDCLDKKGHMHSDILDLVCYLWSADRKDTIILGAASVESLLKQGTASAALDREMKPDRVKDAAQIYAPIVHSGHCSLVVVSRKATKKYILDSCPGVHANEAKDVLTNIESYLRTKHNIDISGYGNETPKVQPQGNNFDCGFHVLLYIRGLLEQSDIFDINKEKVLMLRQELSRYLLFHTKNRKNPTLEPEPVIEETDDEVDDDAIKLISDPGAPSPNAAKSPNPDAPRPDAAKSPNPDDTIPDADKSPNPDAPATIPNPDAPTLDADEISTATKGSTEGTSDSSSEDSQQDSPMDENTGGTAGYQSAADSEIAKSNTASSGSRIGGSQQDPPMDEIADDQSTDNSKIMKSPAVTYLKRRRCSKTLLFVERTPLSGKGCLEVYNLIVTKFIADVVLTVGETKITGGELKEFSMNGQHAESIINAFVHFVKSDDKVGGTNSYHTQRIVLTPEDMKDDSALVSVIEQELTANKMSQRFISCPVTHDGEWSVLLVDVNKIDVVTIVHPSDTKLTSSDQDSVICSLATKFAGHVQQAILNCSSSRPKSRNKSVQVGSLSHHASSKDSAFGCMLCIEVFGGKDVPRVMQSDPDGCKAKRLMYLLLHPKNTAKLPEEVSALVERIKSNSKGVKPQEKKNKKRKH